MKLEDDSVPNEKEPLFKQASIEWNVCHLDEKENISVINSKSPIICLDGMYYLVCNLCTK